MNKTEKLAYLQENHLGAWLKTKQLVEDELSNSQPMFCVCGRLDTGLHERYCRRFGDKIIGETIKRLSHLLKTKLIQQKGTVQNEANAIKSH